MATLAEGISVSPRGEYEVRSGDSLWEIAKNVYGDPLRYKEIAAANGIKNPNAIKPGQTIKLPGMEAQPPVPKARPMSPSEVKSAAGSTGDGSMVGTLAGRGRIQPWMKEPRPEPRKADPSGMIGSPEAQPSTRPGANTNPNATFQERFSGPPRVIKSGESPITPEPVDMNKLRDAAWLRGKEIPSGEGSGISAATAKDATTDKKRMELQKSIALWAIEKLQDLGKK